MKKNKKYIIIATGGTGGHIFPALSLKNELEKHNFLVKVTADNKFAKFYNFDEDHILIDSANFSNRSPIAVLRSLYSLAKGFVKALLLIYKYKPKYVIGFGGYGSYPTMLAAIALNKRIILHEANTVIGKVNRILLWKAEYLTTGFKNIRNIASKYKDKVIFTGNPIRKEIIISSLDNKSTSNDKLSILIIGGSQGAKIFSKIVPDTIINLPKEIKSKLFIYQQVKEEDIESVKEKYKKEGISCEIKSFFNDMSNKLSLANLVIARAGASTISELIAFKLPAIFIPYPSAADNHQYYNAKAIVDINAGWLVKENDNSHEELSKIIKSIHKDYSILDIYSKELESLKTNSSTNIIDLMNF